VCHRTHGPGLTAFGERAVLELMYAALIRASEGWWGIQMKPFEVKQLDWIRAELATGHERRHAAPVLGVRGFAGAWYDVAGVAVSDTRRRCQDGKTAAARHPTTHVASLVRPNGKHPPRRLIPHRSPR